MLSHSVSVLMIGGRMWCNAAKNSGNLAILHSHVN